MTLVAGALVVLAAVVAVARRGDVRIVLALAGCALGIVAGRVTPVLEKFRDTLVSPQFIVPLCSAMGFAYVLRLTGCDRHLVRLLAVPVRRVRGLMIPGAVLITFAINVPIISQAGTVVAVGPVLLPLLRVAGVSPLTAAAALLLGASLGGELLNPGAPELQTVSKALNIPADAVVAHAVPLLAVELVVATGLFWILCVFKRHDGPWPAEELAGEDASFRVDFVKAMVPVVPLALLFIAVPPLRRIGWVTPGSETNLIGMAMLIGAVAALAAGRQNTVAVGREFGRGVVYAYFRVILVIVSAAGFGEGLKQLGLADSIAGLTQQRPGMLTPCAAALPFGFALLCGSGMAATQSVFGFFVEPAQAQDVDPTALGALVAVAAAAGRTISPVAAVSLICATFTGTTPTALARRVAVPVSAAVGSMLLFRALFVSG
jgi:DcuC family C4-dicarboxylate transporter